MAPQVLPKIRSPITISWGLCLLFQTPLVWFFSSLVPFHRIQLFCPCSSSILIWWVYGRIAYILRKSLWEAPFFNSWSTLYFTFKDLSEYDRFATMLRKTEHFAIKTMSWQFFLKSLTSTAMQWFYLAFIRNVFWFWKFK